MNIRKPDKKTLGNKSSSLSFKNKVDFLYDLDRIRKDEYNKLILFMEIRNQFIHNKDAISFEHIFKIIDKKNNLLNIDSNIKSNYEDTSNDDLKEKSLKLAFDKLHLDLIELIKNQFQRLMDEKEIEIKKEINEKVLEGYEFLIHSIDNSFKEFTIEFSKAFSKDKKIQDDLKNLIDTIFYKKLKKKLENKYGEIK